MKNTLILLLLLLFLSGNMGFTQKRNYYLDAVNGSDSNSGKTVKKAWKSLDKVSNFAFQPGDRILLRNGQIFQGSLVLGSQHSGTESLPVEISGYDDDISAPPSIHSFNDFAVMIHGAEYIKISNIHLKGAGRNKGNTTSGLIVSNSRHVIIDSMEVSGYQKHGINVISSEHVRVTRVKAFENGRTGIRAGSDDGEQKEKYPTKYLYIGYCTTHDNAGDPTILDNHSGSGIIVNHTDSAVVEYCSAYNNGWDMPRKGNGPVGIWAHDANNVTIQYCIAYNNQAPKGAWDGGGFDFDGGVTNSLMQYNYSYDNNGVGYGLFQYYGTTVWENNIIRYNISYNDGDGKEKAGIYMWSAEPEKDLLRNCKIYNNVIVNELGHAVRFALEEQESPTDPPGFEFYNNVFISREEPIHGQFSRSIFSNNAFWRLDDNPVQQRQDIHGIYENPGVVLPGANNYRITDPSALRMLEVFRLMPDSPCKGAGKKLEGSDLLNFWGEKQAEPGNIGIE